MKLHKILEHLKIDSSDYDDIDILSLNTLEDAKENELTFLSNKKYQNLLYSTKASAVFVLKDFLPKTTEKNIIYIVCDDPYIAIAKTTALFKKPLILDSGKDPVISKNANILNNVHIGKNTIIGNNVTLMSGSYIGDNVIIDDDTIIYPNATILNDTQIGKNVIIGAGVVIGGDGFGFARDSKNNSIKIYHIGNVIIEDSVEIGSNCTIDRAVFGNTKISSGTKIDNLVHIAHNVQIGKNNFFAGQSGIAGSTKIGDANLFGAQSGVSGHLNLGSNMVVYARGGVTKNLKDNGFYAGFPISNYKDWIKKEAILSKLSKKR